MISFLKTKKKKITIIIMQLLYKRFEIQYATYILLNFVFSFVNEFSSVSLHFPLENSDIFKIGYSELLLPPIGKRYKQT